MNQGNVRNTARPIPCTELDTHAAMPLNRHACLNQGAETRRLARIELCSSAVLEARPYAAAVFGGLRERFVFGSLKSRPHIVLPPVGKGDRIEIERRRLWGFACRGLRRPLRRDGRYRGSRFVSCIPELRPFVMSTLFPSWSAYAGFDGPGPSRIRPERKSIAATWLAGGGVDQLYPVCRLSRLR